MLYKHHDGGLYYLMMEANMEKDGTPMVIYKSMETGKIWVRPAEEFYGKTQTGKSRFTVVLPNP